MTTETEANGDSAGRNKVDWKRQIADYLMPDTDMSDTERDFLKKALEETAKMLAQNHAGDRHKLTTELEDYEAVHKMLKDTGVRDVDLRTRGKFVPPKVRVWLKDTPPTWANTAKTHTFLFNRSGRAHHNGDKTMAVFDVREF